MLYSSLRGGHLEWRRLSCLIFDNDWRACVPPCLGMSHLRSRDMTTLPLTGRACFSDMTRLKRLVLEY